ncbi:MAG: PQQ-dependent catabolism-associated CXXCW motif protein [Alphaproteobacteria bacterium]
MLAVLFAVLVTTGASAGTIAEPAGYRTENYRAPVPATLKGARVVTTDEAIALWKDKAAVFIDVLPHDAKPANLPAGTIWKEKIRQDIPGSIWLANVGYGTINKEVEAYFRKGLESQLGNDTNRKVLFYCMENCWMSWNAAKRAVEWGYRSVLWYPLGTDGWTAAKQPTQKNEPY